jgi:hypothetical protein
MLYSVLELWSFNIFRILMHIAWTIFISLGTHRSKTLVKQVLIDKVAWPFKLMCCFLYLVLQSLMTYEIWMGISVPPSSVS